MARTFCALSFSVLLFAVLAFGAAELRAAPLFFSDTAALQDFGFRSVSLFEHPGVVIQTGSIVFATVRGGTWLTFDTFVTGRLPSGGADILRATYTEVGMEPRSIEIPIPVFGTVFPPFRSLFSFTDIGSYRGAHATLKMDLLSSAPDFIIPSGPMAGRLVDSYTYSFIVQVPVPEPSTLAFLLGAMGVRSSTGQNDLCRLASDMNANL